MTPCKITKAVFPVGGLGTRFLPATKSMPKEMLTVVDKPLIQYAVEEAQNAGIEEFIFITGRGKTVIEDHFDYSYELSAELQKRGHKSSVASINDVMLEPGKLCYVRQQSPLGLGHAVWCARRYVQNEPFAVILADDLMSAPTPCLTQMVQHYQGGNLVALMNVPPADTNKYGIIEPMKTANAADHPNLIQASSVIEKPAPQDAPSQMAIVGRYILDPHIFDVLEKHTRGANGEIQLTDALKAMLPDVPLYGLEFEGRRFDCGSKTGLLRANIAFAMERPDMASSIREALNEYHLIQGN